MNKGYYSDIQIEFNNYLTPSFMTIKFVLDLKQLESREYIAENDYFMLFRKVIGELQRLGYDLIAANSYFHPRNDHPELFVSVNYVCAKEMTQVQDSNHLRNNPNLFLLSNYNAIRFNEDAILILQKELPLNYIHVDNKTKLVLFKISSDDNFEILHLIGSETYRAIYKELVNLNLLNRLLRSYTPEQYRNWNYRSQ
jgi:hypothetical protein